MIRRNIYLNRIVNFLDKPFIKVITGIRRSGKSSLLVLLKEELQNQHISEGQIVSINFESFANTHLQKPDALYQFIKQKVNPKKKSYIILDEVQEVDEWEKVVNSITIDFKSDVYITGSNSQMLSSELGTFLAGRYVEFHIYTLSFTEFLDFRKQYTGKQEKIHTAFEIYLRTGGFPVLHTASYSQETAYKIVFDIYSSIILRDTIQRNNIRDVELLERIIRFVFDNIGNKFSGKNVADYFKSQQRKIDINTVYNYLKALESAYIIHRVHRYDIKGKEILKTQEKFYVSDTALLYALMGYKDRIIAGVLENIVFLELCRREYKVFIGKLNQLEIDFIAIKGNEKIYIQVSYQLSEPSTVDREFGALLLIPDHYPKYVVSMDQLWKDNIQGVQHYHIADFLLLDKF